MIPRLIATDLDGTMMCDVCTVPPENTAAVARAKAAGSLYAVSTGRSKSLIPVAQLPPVDYMICDNGAVIYDGRTGEVLHAQYMPEKETLQLMDSVDRYRVCYEFFSGGELVTDDATAELLKDELFHVWYYSKGNPAFVDNVRGYIEAGNAQVTKLNVMLLDMADYEAVGKALHTMDDIFDVVASEHWYEVTCRGVSKGPALLRLCEQIGVDPADVMAFGDSNNDVTMLAGVGYGVAMGNSTPAALAAAKHVAPPAKEAGVAAYLNKILSEE